MSLADKVKEMALGLGFDAVGITDASPVGPEDSAHLHRWLDDGKAAGMAFMHRNIAKRLNPGELLPAERGLTKGGPGAKSVICVAVGYKPPAQKNHSHSAVGVVADYATFRDYHLFIKEKLLALADALKAESGREFTFKACVDSVPMAERALAARAGLGFVGKSRMLIHPRLGPAIWLGELVTDVELESDRAIGGGCGDCRACLDACPTGALSEDGLDARKCLSYLTIEHKGEIPPEYARKMGNRLFGCDECVQACPFHTEAPQCSEVTLALRAGEKFIDLAEILEWNEQNFKNKTARTPLARPGFQGIRRNAAICIRNSRQ